MANYSRQININTVSDDIDRCIDDFLTVNGIEKDYKSIVNIKHSTVTYLMTYIYNNLFKPDKPLKNNQKSLIDYNDIELLDVVADKYISICQRFNKSLGLMPFSYLVGCSYSTFVNWFNAPDGELNSKRLQVLKKIQENHKQQQVNILNDAPVGALAVANNDIETGLEWAKNQVNQITNNTVYLLPSERSERLSLEKLSN